MTPRTGSSTGPSRRSSGDPVAGHGRTVAIYGGARAVAGDREYEDALIVARALSADGWTVMTGGYTGVMEAASRGASEGGGTAVGITVDGWRNAPNRWLSRAEPAPSVFGRLERLMVAEALIAVGGGVGTLAEVAVAWNLRQKGEGLGAPLITVGERWSRVIPVVVAELGLSEADRALVHTVPSADAAVALVRRLVPGG